jgi:hypothetical protein
MFWNQLIFRTRNDVIGSVDEAAQCSVCIRVHYDSHSQCNILRTRHDVIEKLLHDWLVVTICSNAVYCTTPWSLSINSSRFHQPFISVETNKYSMA